MYALRWAGVAEFAGQQVAPMKGWQWFCESGPPAEAAEGVAEGAVASTCVSWHHHLAAPFVWLLYRTDLPQLHHFERPAGPGRIAQRSGSAPAGPDSALAREYFGGL